MIGNPVYTKRLPCQCTRERHVSEAATRPGPWYNAGERRTTVEGFPQELLCSTKSRAPV